VKVILPILLGSLLAIPFARAQTNSKDSHAEALEVLRRTIQEYDKDPNAAAAKARASVKGARPVPANVPPSTTPPAEPAVTTTIPATPPPAPATAVTTPPPAVTTPPPAATTVTPAPAPAPAPTAERTDAKTAAAPAPSFQEKEREYLDGKISAKEFQKYLQTQRVPVPKGAETTAPAAAPIVAPAPTAAPPTPAAVNDVEQKLQELEKARLEREKAATNAAPASAGPKTKRQRLDDLLRQLVEGKISNEDYKAQREKILSGPE
jgi:hypothetical protein